MTFARSDILSGLAVISYLAVLFNTVLITFNIKYFYILPIFGLMTFLVVFGFSRKKLLNSAPYLIYLGVLALLIPLSAIHSDVSKDTFVAFGLYSLPIIVWLLFNISKIEPSFESIYKKSYLWTSLVGYLGILQFFYSPTLFGLIPINSLALEWAANKSFGEYVHFFRATSVLGSPQVFGLFCGLNLIIAHRYRAVISRNIYYLGGAGLLIGGALSGNKTFFMVLFLYYLLASHARHFFLKCACLVGLLSVFFFLRDSNIISLNLSFLDRIFSLERILEQEQNDSRIAKYLFIIENSNPFVGQGLGSITNKSVEGLRAAESYFLKIHYEAGVFTLATFLLLCLINFRNAASLSWNDGLIVILIVLSMLVVHALESPVFFLIWGYFVSLGYRYKKVECENNAKRN